MGIKNKDTEIKSLNIDTGIPLYYQIKEIIMQKISDGYYKSGDLIPSEEILAREFNVSQGTVRRAMSDLVNAGILYRRSGIGTIVRTQKVEYSIGKSIGKLYGFSEILKEKGLNPSTNVLDFRVIDAKKSGIMKVLELKSDDKVYSISRIKFANDEPLYLEHFYLSYKIFPDLSRDELNLSSLYDLLRNKYGVKIAIAKQFLEPVVVDEYEAKVLGIRKGSPAMMYEGVIYTEKEKPILLSRDIIRGDRCRYYFELIV